MGLDGSGPSALVGHVIAGYRLGRILGTGAMGAVYYGQRVSPAPSDLAASTVVHQAAIKVLILPWQVDEHERDEFRARFLREGQTLRNLRHPHILPVLETGDEADFTFMVLPYMAGGTLASLLASRTNPLPLQQVADYLTQLANALDFAHSKGIVHRDIKPANVLMDEQGQLYLADFSIAHLLSELHTRLTSTGQVLGTPAYMAPEQVNRSHVGPATDIYSLGLVLYQLVAGRVPFEADSPIDLMLQHVQDVPPSPLQHRPNLPKPAAAAILKALAKDPKERFGSAGALAWAFTAALQGQWPDGLLPDLAWGAIGQEATTLQQVYVPPTVSFPPSPDQTLPARRQGFSRRAALAGVVGVAAAAGFGTLLLTRTGLSNALLGITPHLPTATHEPTHTPPRDVGSLIATYRGHADYVDAVSWSPDAQRIASGAWDNTVHIWNSGDGLPVRVYRGHTDHVICVRWSPDGRYLASASDDHTARIWDPNTGTTLRVYRGHSERVWSLAWSPNGQLIASTGPDGTIQVWNATTLERIHTLVGHTSFVRWVAWSPDGSRLASASYDHTSRIWDVASESELVTYTGHIDKCWAISWSPDGYQVASSGDTTVHLWNASSGVPSFVYKRHGGNTWAVAWSPLGRHIASCGADATVHIWDVSTGDPVYVYRRHPLSVNYVAWSPDGKRIGSGSDDHTVQVWQAERT